MGGGGGGGGVRSCSIFLSYISLDFLDPPLSSLNPSVENVRSNTVAISDCYFHWSP